ncbi:hypothetical protein EDB83DRAFT_2315067 [Lactarius deliciosus]|nr:hypothetical protein EDB83DRAFT_2315067 [Lactarius deliciosus]
MRNGKNREGQDTMTDDWEFSSKSDRDALSNVGSNSVLWVAKGSQEDGMSNAMKGGLGEDSQGRSLGGIEQVSGVETQGQEYERYDDDAENKRAETRQTRCIRAGWWLRKCGGQAVSTAETGNFRQFQGPREPYSGKWCIGHGVPDCLQQARQQIKYQRQHCWPAA